MISNSEDDGYIQFPSSLQDNTKDGSPHIEPIFWGTSDILVWDMESIILNIDKDKIFSAIVNENELTPSLHEQLYSSIFLPIFNSITNYFTDTTGNELRGVYGYFPIITEKERIVVLDPSDFHSELLILEYSDFTSDSKKTIIHDQCHITEHSSLTMEKVQLDITTRNSKSIGIGKNGTTHGLTSEKLIDMSVVRRFNPDGDVIVFGGVVLGTKTDYIMRYVGTSTSIGEDIIAATGHTIISLLVDKITVEIRRGLGVSGDSGTFYSLEKTTQMPSIRSKIFEIMSYDERLGMSVNDDGIIMPEFSCAGIFIHGE